MKVREESEKVGLKLNIQKTKIMASGPITSWQRDGETVEIVSDFILGGSKITADGDRSHEIKGHLFLAWKVMTNLDSIFKSTNPRLLHLLHWQVGSLPPASAPWEAQMVPAEMQMKPPLWQKVKKNSRASSGVH